MKLLQFINKFLLLCRGNLCPEMDMELNIIFQGPLIFHCTCDKCVYLRGISVKIVSSQLAEESGSLTAVGIIPPRFTETQTHTSLCKQAVVNYCDMLRHSSVLRSGSLFADHFLLMVRLHLG